MKRSEHASAWAQYSSGERTVLSLALEVLLWMAVLAVVLVVAPMLASNGCGDVAADELGAGAGVAVADGPSRDPNVTPAPDAEAFALAARMRAWRPTWRPRREGELEAVATAIVRACRHDPWPSAERCPDLLGALAFRESDWRADAIGDRLERGLFQLHGVARGGESDAELLDPDVNARLALVHLHRAHVLCRIAGKPEIGIALGCYGSGRCRAYRGSRLLERWIEELRAATGGRS